LKYNLPEFRKPGRPHQGCDHDESRLANYKINKVVHKQNMSKSDMEKFFSIELRDLVRANNVSSLLVWYAGHGKFVSNTGYWIPADAKPMMNFPTTASITCGPHCRTTSAQYIPW